MLRKFTLYLQRNGTDLLKDLFEKGQYSLEDFSNWFRVSKVSKEAKIESVKRIIQRLVDAGLVQYDNDKGSYFLTSDAEVRAVEFVNSGNIRYDLVHHFEKELFSARLLFIFITPVNSNEFYYDLLCLVEQNLLLVNFWKSVNNIHGQLISYVRAEKYHEIFLESKTKSIPLHYIDDVQNDLKDKAYITKFKDYFIYKNHFKKCFDRNCRVCGKNIYNLIVEYLEKVKAEIRTNPEYLDFIDRVKSLPYMKIDNYEEVKKSLIAKVDALIQYDNDKFGKSKKVTVMRVIKLDLKHQLREILLYNKEILKDKQEYKSGEKNKENRQVFFSEMEDLITVYKKITSKFFQTLEPSPILGDIEIRIGKEIALDKKIFQKYNKSIRELGKEGEKRIYEGLKTKYEDHPTIKPRWINEEKEAGLPYDILLSNSNGKDEYIEVKTTHTEQRSFVMSETEYNFAMENSSNYTLYLIVNIGSGPDSYKIVLKNFKDDHKKRLRLLSKRFTFE